MRQEFGKRLWARSCLHINTNDFNSGLEFLVTRSTILKGLKTLLISISHSWTEAFEFDCVFGCRHSNQNRKCSSGFVAFIQFVEQHLQLDSLKLQLHMARDCPQAQVGQSYSRSAMCRRAPALNRYLLPGLTPS